jgi:hypothetical protein
MSEHALLVANTMFAGIGAGASVTMVRLMSRAESQRVGTRHRYWPWLFAMALAAFATASPAYLTYRLASGTLPIQAASQASSSPVPLVPFANPQAMPSSADWRNVEASPWAGPFGPILAVELLQEFQQMPSPCVVKVTAPSENDNLRGTIVWILQYGAKCEVVNNPTGPPDIDQPASIVAPTNNAGLVIHYAADFGWGDNAAHLFDTSSLKVAISHRMPPNSNPHLIWIDIGPGAPWK